MDWTPILEEVQKGIAALVGLLIGWLLLKIGKMVGASTEHANVVTTELLVKQLVKAAEQLYGAGTGEEKLRYVQGQAAKLGLDVTLSQIEAAVHELTAQRSGD